MPTPRSLAELYNWLQSVLPLTWDATKKLVGLPGGLKFPDGTTQATAYTGGGGSGGVTGSGTTGSIPKWNGAAALADSGASMDGNNRLAVPIGIAFPGGSTLDAAPAAGVTGSGAAGLLAFWLSASALSSDSALFWDNTNKRLGIGITPTVPFEVTANGLAAIIDSTDTTGNNSNLILQNLTSSGLGLPGVGFKDGTVYCGDVLGRDSLGFGLVKGVTVSGAAGCGVGFRILGTTLAGSFNTSGFFGIGTNDGQTYALQTKASQAGSACGAMQNTSGTGYSGFDFLDNAGTVRGSMGVGGASSTAAGNALRGLPYLYAATGKDWLFCTGDAVRLRITSAGGFAYDSTDSSGTPGAATINKPTGRSAIAAGAPSVVITNSLVTAASQVRITKRQFDTTLTDYYATCAAGSFAVTGNAAATSAWAFDWQVMN